MIMKPIDHWLQLLLFLTIHVLFTLSDLFVRHLCAFPSLHIWSLLWPANRAPSRVRKQSPYVGHVALGWEE